MNERIGPTRRGLTARELRNTLHAPDVEPAAPVMVLTAGQRLTAVTEAFSEPDGNGGTRVVLVCDTP